jgi:hypothetical protein
MAERFKYGPLIYDTVDDVEDSDGVGNYWWAGLPPVGYDEMGIPIDSRGLQCLPISSPFHPDHISKDPIYNPYINDYVPSIKEWQTWLDENFIVASTLQIKGFILKWYTKQSTISPRFYELQQNAKNLEEMVELVWPPVENN